MEKTAFLWLRVPSPRRFKRWMEQENRRQAMEAEKEVVIGKTRRSARRLPPLRSSENHSGLE